MKKYLIYTLLILFSSGLFAQGIYNNGAKIAVGTGSYLTIGGVNGNYRNETNVTPATIDLSGTLKLTGNLTNNVAGADILGAVASGSLVVLNGTTSQTLGGTTAVPFIFPNLTVNNPAGVVLTNNTQVNGSMTFTSGLVNIGNTNFTFGSSATVAGIPSTTSMIVATGTGQVQKVWSGIGAFTFPIGDNNVTAKYSPVTLNFTSGTFAAGAVAGVNVVNAKYNDPLNIGSSLNRYWNITQTGIAAFTSDATLQYMPSDVTGTESSINTWRVVPTPFIAYNAANTLLHQLSATGLTSFGTFTGGSNNTTLTLTSVMLQGLYGGAGAMRQALQNSSTAQWPSGIADHITIELHDATTYATVVYTATDVPLSTTGTASIAIPASYNGSYYITIKHRNSIETTTATPVSFAGSSVSQSFGDPLLVFGGNLLKMADNSYTIYGADINQDGDIDTTDRSMLLVDLNSAVLGYVLSDLNGDGAVNATDRGLLLTNLNAGVTRKIP